MLTPGKHLIVDRAYPSGKENAVLISGLATCAAVFYLYPSRESWNLEGTQVSSRDVVRYIVAYHAPSGDIAALGSPADFLEANIDLMRDADASNARVVYATPDHKGAGDWPPQELTLFQDHEWPRLKSTLPSHAVSLYTEAGMRAFGALWSHDSADLFFGNIV